MLKTNWKKGNWNKEKEIYIKNWLNLLISLYNINIWFIYFSPLILLASWISFGIIVTLFAWMAQRLVSSNNPTR